MDDLGKIIGHLFYTTSSFVHHFKSICESKLELQFGNAPFRSKSAIFFSRVTLKFDRWPWKTIGHLFYATLSSVNHFKAIVKFKLKLQSGSAQFGSKFVFVPCDLAISRMTLENYRALREFKPVLQSGNAQFGSKSRIFLSRVTLKFDRCAWQTIRRLFYATSSSVHNFVAIGEIKLELQSGNAQFGSK